MGRVLGSPIDPIVFTKFVSSLTGPESIVRITGVTVDGEAELVVVIGTGGRLIAQSDVWQHIAGFSIGQDLGDGIAQMWGTPAQFSLGKSFERFAPVGAAVVTVDELSRDSNRDDLRISCSVHESEIGEARDLQDGRSGSMIFSISGIVSRLSSVIELYPGGLIFAGTLAGVGMGRNSAEYSHAGPVLTTEIEGAVWKVEITMTAPGRKTTQVFKDELVTMILTTGTAVATVAWELDVTETALGRLVTAVKVRNETEQADVTESERAEVLRLRKENADLKLHSAFLRRRPNLLRGETSDTNGKRSNSCWRRRPTSRSPEWCARSKCPARATMPSSAGYCRRSR